jgi:hypothetical protein
MGASTNKADAAVAMRSDVVPWLVAIYNKSIASRIELVCSPGKQRVGEHQSPRCAPRCNACCVNIRGASIDAYQAARKVGTPFLLATKATRAPGSVASAGDSRRPVTLTPASRRTTATA